jgi:hypothetical protein
MGGEQKKVEERVVPISNDTELKECLDLLLDVTYQACGHRTDELDSMCLTAYADAIRYLAKHGLVEIQTSGGRRVIATLKTKEETNAT